MDKNDFEIEIQDETENSESCTQLPLNFLAFGEIENNDVKVYIKQEVYKKLEDYSASDTDKELGSILIGSYCDELGKTNVIISDYIEAKHTDASASTLTFTHETWDYIHKEREKSFSDKKIVGWQHTHPNYGIFLSNYDMFIQENFFNLPFQVAYVIDPIQNIRGFFQWKDGKVEKLKGFYIYDEVGTPVKLETKKKEEKKEPSNSSNGKKLSVISAILSVIVVILGISVINQASKIKDYIEDQKQLEAIVSQQSSEIFALQNKQNNENSESKDDNVSFVKYEVKAGDNLSSICQKHNIDFAKNLNIIKSVNGLTNENSIYAGQILLLPDYSE